MYSGGQEKWGDITEHKGEVDRNPQPALAHMAIVTFVAIVHLLIC